MAQGGEQVSEKRLDNHQAVCVLAHHLRRGAMSVCVVCARVVVIGHMASHCWSP